MLSMRCGQMRLPITCTAFILVLLVVRDYESASEVAQQLRRPNLQRRGDLENDRQRRDIVAAFDETDVGCAHACAFGELVLSEATFLA